MHLSMTDRRTKILRNTVKPVYNDHIVKPVYNDQIQSNLSVSTIEWNSEKDRIRQGVFIEDMIFENKIMSICIQALIVYLVDSTNCTKYILQYDKKKKITEISTL